MKIIPPPQFGRVTRLTSHLANPGQAMGGGYEEEYRKKAHIYGAVHKDGDNKRFDYKQQTGEMEIQSYERFGIYPVVIIEPEHEYYAYAVSNDETPDLDLYKKTVGKPLPENFSDCRNLNADERKKKRQEDARFMATIRAKGRKIYSRDVENPDISVLLNNLKR